MKKDEKNVPILGIMVFMFLAGCNFGYEAALWARGEKFNFPLAVNGIFCILFAVLAVIIMKKKEANQSQK